MDSQEFINQNQNNSGKNFQQNNYNNQNQNNYIPNNQRNNNPNTNFENRNNNPPSQKSQYIPMPQQFINNQNRNNQQPNTQRRYSHNIHKMVNNISNQGHQQFSQVNFNQINKHQFNNNQNKNQQINYNNQNNYQQNNQNNLEFNQQQYQNNNNSNINNFSNEISNLNLQQNNKQNQQQNNPTHDFQSNGNEIRNNSNNNSQNQDKKVLEVVKAHKGNSNKDDDAGNFFNKENIFNYLEDDDIVSLTESIPIQKLKSQKKPMKESDSNNNDNNNINQNNNKNINIEVKKEEKKSDNQPHIEKIRKEDRKYTYQGQTPQNEEINENKNIGKPNFLKALGNYISKEINDKLYSNTPKEDNVEKNDIKLKNKNNSYNPYQNNNNKEEVIKKEESLPKLSDRPIFSGRVENESLQGQSIIESVQIINEIPKEIHNHDLIKESLDEKICTICLKTKSCDIGYKCNSCPLIICDECANKIIIYHYSNSIHDHPLCILNEENCKCNKCNTELYSKKNFYFNCQKCNFNLCLNCYYPERNESIDEESIPIHQHPLKNVPDLNSYKCKLCEKDIIGGGCKCDSCELSLCKECANNIYNLRRKKELHEHPLFLVNNQNWKCNECETQFKEKASFNCSKCSLDFCEDCYLE